MQNGRRAGLIYGTIGSILGGFLWLVIVGIVLKSFVITITPIALGVICFFAVIAFLNRYPERYLSILGMIFVFIAGINLFFVNLLFDKIPYMVGNISTGKECFSLLHVNIILIVFCAIGLLLVLKDYFHKK